MSTVGEPSPGRIGSLLVVALLVTVGGAGAAESDLAELSLQELLAVNLTVATRTSATARESAGIVTLVTAEEIQASGARDLVDVLRLVPGFDIALDVQGVTGFGIRGLWGHEGKVLVLVDGVEMNELLYSTTQLGNHYPLDQVARIEIIRGPGSSVYGGFAELAVVNVVTRSGSERRGFSGELTVGQMADAAGRRTLDLGWGDVVGGVTLSAALFVGEGQRSDGVYTDSLGESYPMEDNAALDPLFLNLGAAWKGLDARLIVDRYQPTQRDLFGENLPEDGDLDFNSWYVTTSYTVERGKWSIVPRLSYQRQEPWVEDDEVAPYHKEAERAVAGLTASYQLGELGELLGGLEYGRDEGHCFEPHAVEDCWLEGGREVDYDNLAAFAQATLRTEVANFTVGARFEDHSEVGSSFVPRLGITRVSGRFHLKILAARAFRAPGFENIHFGVDVSNGEPAMEPEETTAFELEAGYQLGDDAILTANLFDLRVDQPIVYFVDAESAAEGYGNFERTGSRGAELEYRQRGDWGFATLGYSYDQADDNRVAAYAVPGAERDLLGFARHKATLLASFRLGHGMRLSPSLVYRSERHGYVYDADEGGVVLTELESLTHLNLYWSLRDLAGTGLELGVGVFDLLDDGELFVQPYDSGHPPLPGPSREWVLRLGYRSEAP